MINRSIDMTGHRVKSWRVLCRTEPTEKMTGRDALWLCQCLKCGTTKVFRGRNLRKEEVATCDCFGPRKSVRMKYGCDYCLDVKTCTGKCKYADFFEKHGGFFEYAEKL